MLPMLTGLFSFFSREDDWSLQIPKGPSKLKIVTGRMDVIVDRMPAEIAWCSHRSSGFDAHPDVAESDVVRNFSNVHAGLFLLRDNIHIQREWDGDGLSSWIRRGQQISTPNCNSGTLGEPRNIWTFCLNSTPCLPSPAATDNRLAENVFLKAVTGKFGPRVPSQRNGGSSLPDIIRISPLVPQLSFKVVLDKPFRSCLEAFVPRVESPWQGVLHAAAAVAFSLCLGCYFFSGLRGYSDGERPGDQSHRRRGLGLAEDARALGRGSAMLLSGRRGPCVRGSRNGWCRVHCNSSQRSWS